MLQLRLDLTNQFGRIGVLIQPVEKSLDFRDGLICFHGVFTVMRSEFLTYAGNQRNRTIECDEMPSAKGNC
jgi:hypothetical protein